MSRSVLQQWHQLVKARDAAALPGLLADQVVFHSPVVHTPQIGRRITCAYLTAALAVFGHKSFHYVREVCGEHDAMLEFEVELDGVHVNGVDMIRWNDAGQITDFKVMLRPLQAVNLIHQKMASILTAKRPATPDS